jgi:hypothetical protein
VSVIQFDNPDTWRSLVEDALLHGDDYAVRLKVAGIEQAYGDCSGLGAVFARPELTAIVARIALPLPGRALRLYHGCRLEEGADPRRTGLQPSSMAGIVRALLDLAARDPVLRSHRDAIVATVEDPSYQE